MFSDLQELKMLISEEEKKLLLHSINIYMEKIDFILNNYEYYNEPIDVRDSFRSDYETLFLLRQKLFSIELEEEGS